VRERVCPCYKKNAAGMAARGGRAAQQCGMRAKRQYAASIYGIWRKKTKAETKIAVWRPNQAGRRQKQNRSRQSEKVQDKRKSMSIYGSGNPRTAEYIYKRIAGIL